MKHEAFILRTKAGQWMFQVHRDGVEIGGGAGFADQFEAIEAAQEAFGHVEGLALVVQAGSVQGGGGVESLPTPEAVTARYPTQRIFPPGADIQTAGRAAQAA